MNLLGIDFGTKRTGVAWVDTDIGVVLPLGLVEGKNLAEISKKLIKIILEEKPDKIIFGLPVSLDNQESANTNRVREFAKKIKEQTKIEIDFMDERFSSQMADREPGLISRDEASAVIILSDYLNKK
jgi:putative Holliday junction resolvase